MTRSEKIPVVIIFGATASGKTALAERLFTDAFSVLRDCAEIISADSMQVYKGMDIGTAKPDKQLQKKLPHHLIDMCLPNEQFSAAEFVHRSDECCTMIFQKHKIPVMLGGTAFYIKNFMYGLPCTPQADLKIRQRLQEDLHQHGKEILFTKLTQVDPLSAQKIHPNDEYRILRALEVFETNNQPLSSYALSGHLRPQYDFCIIALERPRQELFARINERVEQMFALGLPSEVNCLMQKGYTAVDPGMNAIGYREFFLEKSLEDTQELIRHNSRKYAKRQMTFFKSLTNVDWFFAEDFSKIETHLCSFFKAHT